MMSYTCKCSNPNEHAWNKATLATFPIPSEKATLVTA